MVFIPMVSIIEDIEQKTAMGMAFIIMEMILKKKEEAGKFFETFFTGNKFQAIYTLKTRKIPYWVSIEAVEENNKTTKYVVLERI